MTPNTPGALPKRWTRLLPALAVASVALAGGLVQIGLINCRLSFSPCRPNNPTFELLPGVASIEELTARMIWCAAVFVFLSAAMMTIGHAWTAWREAKREEQSLAPTSARDAIVAGVVVLVGITLTIGPTTEPFGPGADFLKGARSVLPER